MQYIIDGNNFIKRGGGGEPGDFEDDKKELVSRLLRYTFGKKVKITLVFDSRNPRAQDFGGVKVIHAEDADARIASEVSGAASPASVAVVSNDREVIRDAKAKGARTMKVDEFGSFLDKKLKKVKAVIKTDEKPSPSEEDVEGWIKEYALRKAKGE